MLVCALAAGCSEPASETAPESGPASETPTGATSSTSPSPLRTPEPADPDQPTSWGPTVGELERAGRLVAEMSTRELAGQVIVGRYDGTDPAAPAAMVRDLHLAGVSVASSNVADEAQVRATTAAVSQAHAADGRDWPAVIGVDEEGGVVSHLGGVATEFPPFAAAGAAVAGGRAGEQVVTEAARATSLELRDLGFTWVFAPVADVTIGSADPTIGSRSPSGDPALAARAVGAAVEGYEQGGLVSTTKHFPGHGGVTADSHLRLPVLRSSLPQLRGRDLRPFEAAVEAGAPAIMMAHLDVRAMQAGTPSSQAPKVYDYLRDELGFEGVTITDSLGMGAALSEDFPAIRALRAGADLLLMPVDTATTHQLVVDAVESGDVPRARVVEAATRVVALQLWQQRVAADVRVPADVVERAERAAAELAAAGS
ncbi:glycosyl hyrolase family 3 [Nocardioides euryhalodurans]|uniref:beta-N-acetylhexosaminidase n=2 Tax=Nocardioides euryhalodurans TaxID=2518370 RepID=A0A4P7GQV7_9ACTN|nr:glycosyl hyrolase family 3 [Nocardioides euryhalodurans]